nr:unnamed protein product [Digitaria exilis]
MASAGTGVSGDEKVTVRTSGHGHGYSSSHSGGHTSGGTAEQGGAGVVDPRNLNARSHPRSAAIRRAAVGGYSFVVVCGLLGAILAVLP